MYNNTHKYNYIKLKRGGNLVFKGEITVSKERNGIEIEYIEQDFSPTENTGIRLYDRYKISILLTDGLMVVADDTVTRTEKGDFLLFRPDEIHFGRIMRKEKHKFLNLLIPVDYFNSLNLCTSDMESMLEHRNKPNCIRPHIKDKEQLYQIIAPLINNIKCEKNINTLSSYTDVLSTLILLEKLYRQNGETVIESNIPDCVTKTLNYISQNFSEKISLKILAENSYCSVTYLSKIFKDYMGCTVYEYLTNYRIDNSKKLLNEGKSVTEVSFECGFGDCSHFIKTFKEVTGLTPHTYRKNNINMQ